MGKIKAKFYEAVLALEMFLQSFFPEHEDNKLKQESNHDGIVNDYVEDEDVETYMSESERKQLNEMRARFENE